MEGQDPSSSARSAALSAFASGDGRTIDLLAAALRDNPHDGALLIADAAAKQRSGVSDALARLEEVLKQAPDWIDGHKALARLKAEAGDPQPFGNIEQVLDKLPRHPGLWMAYLGLLAAAGRHSEAASHTANLQKTIGNLPGLRLIEARHRGFCGELREADLLLGDLPDSLPELHYERARNALRQNRLDRAAIAIDQAIAMDQNDIGAWALAELCWRRVGDSRHAWLYGDWPLTAQIDLDLGEAALAQLAKTLRALDFTRAAPLGQSVKGGTQTHGDLIARRENEIALLFKRIRKTLGNYALGLASLPDGHPLSALRNSKPRIVASWSIRLTQGGQHIPHLHDNGLISSAVHIEIPREMKATEGLLELGRPPDDIPLALDPIARFAPRPGHLVLFPSFLYHGTSPFAAGERLTVAFDAV